MRGLLTGRHTDVGSSSVGGTGAASSAGNGGGPNANGGDGGGGSGGGGGLHAHIPPPIKPCAELGDREKVSNT